MGNQTEEFSEELKRKAYLAGQRLKSSGLEAEVIYARLEKQGIPESLAKQVVKDLWKMQQETTIKEATEDHNYALVRIGIGIVAAIISWIVLPNNFILPIGLIGGGIISAIIAKNKMSNKS